MPTQSRISFNLTKASSVKGARDRKRKANGKCEGRKSFAERDPGLVDMARWLHHNADVAPMPWLMLRRTASGSGGLVTEHYARSHVEC